MGGQACVFYGAAEFSRDTDLAVLADASNLSRLRKARAELQADPIAALNWIQSMFPTGLNPRERRVPCQIKLALGRFAQAARSGG